MPQRAKFTETENSFDSGGNSRARLKSRMALIFKNRHKRLWKPSMLAVANERLLDAVLNSREIVVGALRIRCLMCHFAEGFYPKARGFGTHKHLETQIEIPLAGRFVFCVDNKKIELKPAQALVIPGKAPHSWHTPTGGFMMGLLVGIKNDFGTEIPLPLVNPRRLVVSSDAISGNLRRLVDLSASPQASALGTIITSSLLMALIAEILDAVCRFSPIPEPATHGMARGRVVYERAHSFITSNFGQPLSASDLAKQAGVSVRHLTRIFLEHCSEAPHQHILRIRLDHAQAMMQKDRFVPVKQLAYECGFSSSSHFSMAFKKHFGVTPNAFAARGGARLK